MPPLNAIKTADRYDLKSEGPETTANQMCTIIATTNEKPVSGMQGAETRDNLNTLKNTLKPKL